jgi:hypothetical protein
MPTVRFALVASLMAAACEDKVADKTEQAAERVTKTADHLRHERSELAAEVAERADDRANGESLAPHADDIADEVEDVSREAGRLAEAERDFENLRALRVAALRAEHSVAASQPLLILTIANELTLPRERRSRLDENLVIFRQRLAHTRKAIEELQTVKPADWERRDDELGRAMAGMFLARDASWQALDPDHREDEFPGT